MEILYSWTFSSTFERTKHWYIIASSIIISAVIVSFLIGEFLLGIVLILFAGVYLLYDINMHPEVRIAITQDGISINESMYDYTKIISFNIVKLDNKPFILRLQTTIKTLGSIDIFIDPALNFSDIRTYLQSRMPEDAETDLTGLEKILLGLKL